MKTQNDMLLDLTSHYVNTPVKITKLALVTVSSDDVVVFFIANGNFKYIIFDTSTSNDIISANILINHFNAHPDVTVTLYYTGDINGLTTERIALIYDYVGMIETD